VLDLLDREAGIVVSDDKTFDLARALLACPDDIDVGEGGIANPGPLARLSPGVRTGYAKAARNL
jgi:hypothetical protein